MIIDNNKIISFLAKDLQNKIKDPFKSFKDQDIDSLDRFTIILEIGDKLNLDFPEEEMVKFNSINDIAKYLLSIKKI